MMENILPEIPRAYTAIAEWAACLLYVILLKKRYSIGKTCMISAGFLGIMTLFLVATDNVNIIFWVPCMVIAYLFMAVFVYTCCRVSVEEAIFFSIWGFVISEFTAFTDSLLFTYGSLEGMYYSYVVGIVNARFLSFLDLLLVCTLTNVIFMLLLRKYFRRQNKIEFKRMDVFLAVVTGVVVFTGSNISFLSSNTILSGTYYLEIVKLHLFIDLAGMIMLYAQFVRIHEGYTQRELDAVQNLLQNQYQQYKMSRESINLIHYKYHDLKHQIAVLRAEENPKKRQDYLDAMEKEIKQYELQNKTGNGVLDTVLTGKSMYCDKHGITLTVVADGKWLEFMDVMDICSIFGNALDNAIESELKIEDKEKRLIHVTVSKQMNFLMIRIENYFEAAIKSQEGNFLTTKKDKDLHGYGIKSIRYTVEKYHGAVTIDTSNHWFDLKILIPLS